MEDMIADKDEVARLLQPYIIVGDECYLRECLDKKIPTGSSYCPEKSRKFVEKYGSWEYTILLCHDK